LGFTITHTIPNACKNISIAMIQFSGCVVKTIYEEKIRNTISTAR
jgi:hypothetical protein